MADNETSPIKKTDSMSPFFVSQSDSPGILLTNVVLRGESNYDTWVKAMKNALHAKNKLDFITGSVTAPNASKPAELHAWGVCNSMINGWIHNTIDPQLQPFIKYYDTAKAY
ncbi:uncharacterized protein LOC133311897 [Gastrolobium bilobum]|uniref:uncharacterized protein LOC133311897 n=1 Tax=Gastrolobium bilobum TaxID=150636 RepID=UPI002AAF0BD0|nr:uncharacterized protein LOC133311897 [Gastrolobium bilobum]